VAEVWQANPQFTIPSSHPGDVISLSYVNGRARLGLSGQDGFRGPRIRGLGSRLPIKPVTLTEIEAFSEEATHRQRRRLKAAPHVVATKTPLNGATVRWYTCGTRFARRKQVAMVRPLWNLLRVT